VRGTFTPRIKFQLLSSNHKMEKEKLKQLLEDTAKESGLKITGEIATLKTPEQKEAEQEIQDWKKDKKKYDVLKEFKIPHELLGCLLATEQYEG